VATNERHEIGPLAAVTAPIRCMFESRELVYYLTRQRIVLRYRGSLLGIAWMILSPALMLAIYTLVFGVIFKPRWAAESQGTAEYALLLYLGLCAYWFLSECVAEAPGLIVQHANYVKKVVFPLDILVWVSVSAALFHTIIRLLVFAVAYLLIEGHLPLTIVLLPLVWLPLALMTLGISWLLSAMGVFVRDLGEVVTLALTAMLFLSPVFYSVESLPEAFRWLILVNPITQPISQIRDVAYFGALPGARALLLTFAISYVAAWLGHAFFVRSRRAFADAL
jgi:homopolymeric O-antigen transport system permease protein